MHSRQEIQPSPTGPPHLLHRSPPLSAFMLPPTPWSSAEPIVVLWGDGASFPKALKYHACNNEDTASHWKEMAPMETSGDAVFSPSFLGPAQTYLVGRQRLWNVHISKQMAPGAHDCCQTRVDFNSPFSLALCEITCLCVVTQLDCQLWWLSLAFRTVAGSH